MYQQNNIGYRRSPINASSVDASSLVSYPIFQMPTFAPSSIPKPPANSFTAFYDSSNSNRLSKKSSNGTISVIETKSTFGYALGSFQALIGPTNTNATHTSVQAALTDGYWRMRIIESFTEPSTLSFTNTPSGSNILIYIDKGITWTTANIITYTSGSGNITFTGYGTFKYTIGGSGAIALAANQRVTFDSCNITNAASVNTCLLAAVTTSVVITNSVITLPNQTSCFVNSSAYVSIIDCVITGGGASTTDIINTTGVTNLSGLYTSSFTCTSATVLITVSNVSSNISDVSLDIPTDLTFTGCRINNLFMNGTSAALLTFSNCQLMNVNVTSGAVSLSTTASTIIGLICGAFTVSISSCVFANIVSSGVFTYSATGSKFANCLLHDGTALTLSNDGTFDACLFNGNTTNSATASKFTDCSITGTLVVSGQRNEFSNLTVSSTLTVSNTFNRFNGISASTITISSSNCNMSDVFNTGTITLSSASVCYLTNITLIASANIVFTGTTYSYVVGYNSSNTNSLTTDASSTNNSIVNCIIQGNPTLSGTLSNYLGCQFTGTLTSSGTSIQYIGCQFTDVTIGASNNQVVDCTCSATFTTNTSGTGLKLCNSSITGAATLNATNCNVSNCSFASTIAIGGTTSATGLMFSNNNVTGQVTLASTTGSFVDNTVFTSNNFAAATPIVISNAPTAPNKPLFVCNKIGAGGANSSVPATILGNSHPNSTGNSSIA